MKLEVSFKEFTNCFQKESKRDGAVWFLIWEIWREIGLDRP